MTPAELAAAHPILEWIKATPVGEFVRSSSWAFPTLQSLHFIGMTMLVGVVGAIDLRVLGLARGLPIHPLHRFLPLAFVGFGINLITGLMFFAHDPYVYAYNISFRIKMLLSWSPVSMRCGFASGCSSTWTNGARASRLRDWQKSSPRCRCSSGSPSSPRGVSSPSRHRNEPRNGREACAIDWMAAADISSGGAGPPRDSRQVLRWSP